MEKSIAELNSSSVMAGAQGFTETVQKFRFLSRLRRNSWVSAGWIGKNWCGVSLWHGLSLLFWGQMKIITFSSRMSSFWRKAFVYHSRCRNVIQYQRRWVGGIMIQALIIIFALILLVILLYFEKRGSKKSILITKSILSLLFVVTALLQPRLVPQYYFYLLAGLIFCLIGDVCLALPGEKMFLAGLGAFLLGHVFYIISFSSLTSLARWISPGAGIIACLSTIIFFWLRPHLKSMLVPVLFYILVITVMFSGAWAVFWKSAFPAPAKVLILMGASCFYFSDLFVARDKFIRDEFQNRLIGLPLYYLGQFSLAFSAGLL
jgi:uncharacterized membrane protein YhhN